MLSPLTWLLLAMVSTWIGVRRRGRGRWWLGVGALVACVAIVAMTPGAANTLVRWLERPGAVDASCRSSPPTVAVVLAGGVDREARDADDFTALTLSTRRRVEQAVQWWPQVPDRALVMAGGAQEAGSVSVASLMAGYARRLGVGGTAVRIEGRSLNTWENARALRSLHPAVPRRVVLVTSAMHMPRARYAMQQAGFTVCEEPADSRWLAFGMPGYVTPGSSALVKTEAALHEIAGLAYYRWRAARGSHQDRPSQASSSNEGR